MNTLKKNVSEIRRLVHIRQELQALIQFLVLKGISQVLAEEIALELSMERGDIAGIKDKLASRIRVTDELSFDRPHQFVLVGPTGVGKTATLIKLAEYYHQLKRRVGVASLDDQKKEILKRWADSRQIPFCESLDYDGELLLVDTEGCNFYQPNRVEAIGEKMGDWGGEIVLVLSAAAQEVDLYGAIHQFSLLAPSSLIFTKLDETLASGVLFNICVKTELPIRYVAFGYPLPGDLQVAKSELIARKILTDFNQDEFQLLRRLSMTSR